MSYYKCKNCNYETSRFPDIRIHLSKPHFCKTEFNNYCFKSIDHKIILSLISSRWKTFSTPYFSRLVILIFSLISSF